MYQTDKTKIATTIMSALIARPDFKPSRRDEFAQEVAALSRATCAELEKLESENPKIDEDEAWGSWVRGQPPRNPGRYLVAFNDRGENCNWDIDGGTAIADWNGATWSVVIWISKAVDSDVPTGWCEIPDAPFTRGDAPLSIRVDGKTDAAPPAKKCTHSSRSIVDGKTVCDDCGIDCNFALPTVPKP